MKNIIALILLTSSVAYSQNTFPASGNVGVGTTTPEAKLTVSQIGNGWYDGLRINRDASNYLTLTEDVTDVRLKNWGTGGIRFFTSIGEQMTILNNGNIGIGTSAPGSKLHVDGGHVYVGPLSGSLTGNGRLSVSGQYAEVSFSNRAVTSFVESPTLGERFVIYNDGVAVDGKLRFWSGGDKMTLTKDGNFGIGTGSPVSKLHLGGTGTVETTISTDATTTSRSVVTFNRGLSSWNVGMNMDVANTDNFHFRYNGTYPLTLQASSGNIGIGTTTPDAKLAVKGQIHAQEVKVDLNGAVAPDYVFASNYQLPTLDYIKAYIDQNKHLPEVPSAKEIEANGVNLGEMNMLLLKKIEELTLYVIELKKENELASRNMKKMQSEIDLLTIEK